MRRRLLDEQLRDHKQEKLKRKIPTDAQFLAMAKEDLGLKRQMLEDMNAAEKQYSANFAAQSQTLQNLSQTMDRGFGMLNNLLTGPGASPSAHLSPASLYSQIAMSSILPQHSWPTPAGSPACVRAPPAQYVCHEQSRPPAPYYDSD